MELYYVIATLLLDMVFLVTAAVVGTVLILLVARLVKKVLTPSADGNRVEVWHHSASPDISVQTSSAEGFLTSKRTQLILRG